MRRRAIAWFGAVCRHLGISVFRVMLRPFGAARERLGTDSAIVCRELSAPELVPLAQDSDLELRPQQIRQACARGDVCLGAFDDGQLVGYVWLAFGPAPHTDGSWVECDPQARYSYKKFVRPAWRGHRVAHALSALGDEPEFRRGRAWNLSFVNVENEASYRATLRGGSRPVGFAGYARWGRLMIPFRSPGAGKAGARFCAGPPGGARRGKARPIRGAKR